MQAGRRQGFGGGIIPAFHEIDQPYLILHGRVFIPCSVTYLQLISTNVPEPYSEGWGVSCCHNDGVLNGK